MNKITVNRATRLEKVVEGELFEDPDGVVWVVARVDPTPNVPIARPWEIVCLGGRSRRWEDAESLTAFLRRTGYKKLLPGDSFKVEVK